MRRVGIIILAAGASSRLGRPKQLMPFQGQSLLLRAAQTALATICQPVVVVLGAHGERTEREILHLPVKIAHNPEWQLGMGASIKAGLTAMAATHWETRPEAALIMVSDQPFITASVLNHLVYSFQVHGGIVASAYNNTFGVPAVFGKEFHRDLISLSPERGAKVLFEKHRERVHAVSFPEGAIDIDTLADYERLTGHC